jgi:hypothetical protein
MTRQSVITPCNHRSVHLMKSKAATLFVVVLLLAGGLAGAADKTSNNGFVIDDPLVPKASILSGGPPRDGIPAIDNPEFVGANSASFMSDDERVLGVNYRGVAKAYPLRILNRHEIVNDSYSGQSIVVTFCPLCGSGVVFDAEIDGASLDFGVSGLLYNSDVLLYDRQTESLWSQIMARSVSGKMKGRHLQLIVGRNTTWQDWRSRYPDTLVMTTNTGYRLIDYDNDPYADYKKSKRVWFPLSNTDRRRAAKDYVLGITAGPGAKAYPLDELFKHDSPLIDVVGTTTLRIEFDANHGTAAAYNEQGHAVPSILLYWFAWAAFHPDSDLYASDAMRQ